jgi:mannose-6-phosphate isomerase-like protein (cupin superfamily)
MAVEASEIIPKVWGSEKIIVNGPLYCGKILTVIPNGMACSIHYHKNKTETFYILHGQLEFEKYDPKGKLIERTVLKTGHTLTLPPSTPHRFWVLNEICEFVEFSTHDDPLDSYRLVPSGPRPQ